MPTSGAGWKSKFGAGLLLAIFALPCYAGVSRAIQDKYRKNYENKALFLKIPLYSEKQYVYISGQAIRPEQGAPNATARLKVGDQIRIVGIDFGGDDIKFKCTPITGAGLLEIIFKFDSSLQENFPNSNVFENALQATFTEGLKYSDLEDAKRGYVEDQFDRIVREFAAAAGTNREAVLKSIAPRLPAYQDAMHDIENLKGKNQDLAAQLTQTQSDVRKLEVELKTQQSENTRLRSANSALQEKIDNSTSQLSRLGDDLRTARGVTQGYQRELANLQRSLNLKIDANRDLGAQISELGQAMRRIQKENDGLESQNNSLRTSIQSLQSDKTRLNGEVEDLKSANKKMKDTIDTLSSKEDSLARQYLQLKQTKENLENITNSVDSLSGRVVDERTEGGIRTAKVDFYLKNVLLGSLEYQFPAYLAQNTDKIGEAQFSVESIDYVRVTPEERALLRTLGDKFKLQIRLTSPSPTMEVQAEKDGTTKEIGERDRATWRWKILNRGTSDTRLAFSVFLINKNSDAIPLLKTEQLVASSSVVRQVRNTLQPIPLGIGGLLGLLLAGVIRIFWRPRHPAKTVVPAPVASHPAHLTGRKQL